MLLSLPPELLSRIVEFTMPEGFENLALSCHTMYEVARPRLPTHNLLRKEWSHLVFHSFEDPAPTMVFLHSVAKDPIRAKYVKSADLRYSYPAPGPHTIREFQRLTDDAAAKKELVAFIAESRLISPSDTRRMDWANRILRHGMPSDGGAETRAAPQANWATAFLLAQLTNVSVLTLGIHWKFMEPADAVADPWQRMDPDRRDISEPWDLLQSISRLSHDICRSSSPLSKLTELRALSPSPVPVSQQLPLQSLSPFLGLRGLEKLCANGCLAVDNPEICRPFQWPHPDLASNLGSIEFLACCIDDRSLSNLLAYTPNLVSFKYSHYSPHQTSALDVLTHWDAGAFIAVVDRHCGRQLTTLAVTVHRLVGNIVRGVVSLRNFSRLVSAELDVAIFAGPPFHSGLELVSQGDGSSPGPKLWTPPMVPRLTDVLPPSLRRLRLFTGCRNDHSDIDVSCALMEDFAAGRDSLLPALDDAMFCQRILEYPESIAVTMFRQKLIDSAEAAGIEYRAGLAMFPQWYQQFAWTVSPRHHTPD